MAIVKCVVRALFFQEAALRLRRNRRVAATRCINRDAVQCDLSSLQSVCRTKARLGALKTKSAPPTRRRYLRTLSRQVLNDYGSACNLKQHKARKTHSFPLPLCPSPDFRGGHSKELSSCLLYSIMADYYGLFASEARSVSDGESDGERRLRRSRRKRGGGRYRPYSPGNSDEETANDFDKKQKNKRAEKPDR